MEASLNSYMVDLHCHVLPGLDDGPQSVEEALEMCRVAHRDGIRTLVAAPHTLNGIYINDVKTVMAAVEGFNNEIRSAGLEMKVLPGSDVYVDPSILQMIQEGQVATLNHPGKAVMLEFPEYLGRDHLWSFVESLVQSGMIPVISHPERTPQFRDSAVLRELVEIGAVSQITALSLTGGFGQKSQQLARSFLEEGLVHVVASDAHSIQHRPPVLSRAVAEAAKMLGKEQAKSLVVENPRAILEGNRPQAPRPAISTIIQPSAAAEDPDSSAVQEVDAEPVEDSSDDGKGSPTVTPAPGPDEGARDPLTIAILSNKGGVGKTHFSINLACALGTTGAKVLLIDADLGNADISNKLGFFPKYHLLHFLDKEKTLEELVVRMKFKFDLICSASGELKLANLNYGQKMRFIRQFQRISKNYHYAIFDLSAGISRTVLDFALASDKTVVVSTPQDLISGYACAKAAFFRFKEHEERLVNKLTGYKPAREFSPRIVLNQVARIEHASELFSKINRTAQAHINAKEDHFHLKPEYLGAIPYDVHSVRDAEAKRSPLLLEFPNIRASYCIYQIAKKFYTPENIYEPRAKIKNPFRRFAAIIAQRI